ncbi:MAG TPA: DUF1553 domain-containing protein, partial [Bryobacteraceae bacterium]|nr:DUF1553 domain-containing protein [Bryobacteraceae bacterium]
IAGDLLPQKRLRSDGAAFESPLGTTALWFGEVLNSATDSEKSRADDVDNQIDVLSKAFQGMTVACARCHDHKFDPIPTSDYYALAGVLHSTDMREAAIDSPEKTRILADLSTKIRSVNDRIAAISGGMAQPPTAVQYRPEDKVYERFDAGTFDKWVVQSAAFGNAPVNGSADSRAAGSNAFMGTLTSPQFRAGKELFLHIRLGGTPSDPKLKERSPLRVTIVADGYKGEHVFADTSGKMVWKTIRLTFARERMCYLEIVDRSREGHIIVDEIVFSSLDKPPAVAPAPELAAKPLSESAAAEVARLESEKARLEALVPVSEFAMVAEDGNCRNIKLHIRGSHKNLGDEVPRRFLQVVAGERQPPVAKGSGRLEIAEWMASPNNPLTARVMVNRIWKHHFAQGLVRSLDNFGQMGEEPTHPELLDFLASEFVRTGWSIKAMHRLMLTSSTYQMSSTASAAAKQSDPSNKLLQHMPVRRLEAEAIRDSILSISETLDRTLFGPSIVPHISEYQDGRGKPVSGPLDANGRRSIYVQVRRNFITPMFLAFDYPLPISAIGARTSSTVPSQALMMMNNELVAQQANKWASRETSRTATPEDRLRRMYETAFGRLPTGQEQAEILAFLRSQPSRPEADVWADVAHVLFNSPEFVYVP